MEGMCKCGGRIKEGNHKVTTDAGAAGWLEPMSDYTLPLSIETSTCQSCGRRMTVAKDATGRVISENG